MNVLALDSACAACSAAVVRGGAVLAERFQPMSRGHVEALMPMVGEVLDRAGIGFDALDLVAVTVGPGSFTGLRAGLAAARGIALARALPLDGVTTLEAVAHAARAEAAGRPVLVAIETRRADLYVQLFGPDGTARSAPAALLAEAAATLIPASGCLLAGDGAKRLAAALPGRSLDLAEGPGLPRAADVAAIVLGARACGRPARPPPPV
jgi:tRNA threonylcarbamoyladenosine biosynthesis protein TsaB